MYRDASVSENGNSSPDEGSKYKKNKNKKKNTRRRRNDRRNKKAAPSNNADNCSSDENINQSTDFVNEIDEIQLNDPVEVLRSKFYLTNYHYNYDYNLENLIESWKDHDPEVSFVYDILFFLIQIYKFEWFTVFFSIFNDSLILLNLIINFL